MRPTLTFIAALVAVSASPALAQTGNGAPKGPHYNLNILGVENAKKQPLTSSNRHSIFVALKSTKTGQKSVPNYDTSGTGVQTAIVDSKIWLVPGDSFKVCDGNGFDAANGCDDTYLGDWVTNGYDSDGNPILIDERRMGAVFQLPCNTNLNGQFWDSDGDGVVEDNGDDAELDELVRCNTAVDENGQEVPVDPDFDIVPTANYQVWARALGKPGGSAVSTTCATVQGELQCSLENMVLTRTTGKSIFTDVTDATTSLVIGYCQGTVSVVDNVSYCDGNVTWTRIALFAGNTQDWFWNFDNNGLRLAQLRFYEVEEE